MFILIILAVALFGIAVALCAWAFIEPRARRSENLAGIDAYGYVTASTAGESSRKSVFSVDDLATSLGDLVARRVITLREAEIQRELIAAGFFKIGVRKFIGYRVILAIGLPLLFIWLLSLNGSSLLTIVFFALVGFAIGWVGPNFYVHRRASSRLREIDDALPGLIDLLVVTLEAGIGFTGALRLASERLTGPLGEEIRLTIQEQSLGLSVLESLENWGKRCDTPAVHSFVRAMVQGDRLGVSIGSILRNQAVEMRARQKATVEERAQKAPIKILFPLVFLIFPAMFVIILGPAMFAIRKSLHG